MDTSSFGMWGGINTGEYFEKDNGGEETEIKQVRRRMRGKHDVPETHQ